LRHNVVAVTVVVAAAAAGSIECVHNFVNGYVLWECAVTGRSVDMWNSFVV